MKIALIQSDLVWENVEKNRTSFEAKINSIVEEVQLIILPEMFTTGFSMHATSQAETMRGETIDWMKNLAKHRNLALTGSLIITDNGNFYNRLVFVFPSGEVQFYDKRHLFTLANEDQCYTKGTSKLIVDYLGFKICPLICYDLRFPVFSRNTENYDVLIYVANWPKIRTQAWNALLKARAIENVCYSIGVNRVGMDAHNFEHVGHSQVNDYLGNSILSPQENEGIFIVNIDKTELVKTRKKLAFLEDQDEFTIRY